tara:strand:+ start:848 stop:1024 length:177 start_codon:yes stop_codon:yes gene_type:complete
MTSGKAMSLREWQEANFNSDFQPDPPCNDCKYFNQIEGCGKTRVCIPGKILFQDRRSV